MAATPAVRRPPTPEGWTPASWRGRPIAQEVRYPDEAELEACVERLRALPPLVSAGEVSALQRLLADAAAGRRFVLVGGDCAETIEGCAAVASTLEVLDEMARVLAEGGRGPVVRVGRMAGQYAKPRTSPTETQAGTTLPSYFGDLVNRPEFDARARRPDPRRLLDAYEHAAATLALMRSLSASDAAGHASYTAHEGLHLPYESALTRAVPGYEGHWDLSAHLPWIGDRTRDPGGAHVELFRGVQNPVGVKIGPQATAADVLALIDRLDPLDRPAKVVLITRMGAAGVAGSLPPLLRAVSSAGRQVLWLCDPMHGNTVMAASGHKTRAFGDIVAEMEATLDAHEAAGTILGGVHFELTGDDVTECVGGNAGITEHDLPRNYESRCDPRLNRAQALELAQRTARRLRRA